jgi:hypothetical protein
MRLRRSLAGIGGAVLETVPGGYYRLNLEPAAVDAVSSDERAGEGRRDLARGNATAAGRRWGCGEALHTPSSETPSSPPPKSRG